MSRTDAIGLVLVLALAAAGLGWMTFLRGAPEAPPERPPDPIAALAAQPGGGRVPLGALREEEPRAGIEVRFIEKNRAAIAALEAGEHERAVALFEECCAAHPEHPTFAANLAEALARLARALHDDRATRADALRHLARAVELAPARADLAELLAQWKKLAEAEEGFWTDESLHFALSYDGERSELLHVGHAQLLEELEATYQDFGELFGRHPLESGRRRIQVVLYRQEEFADLTGLGHWAGGVFDGVVRIPLEDLGRERRELTRVLRHELAHAYVAEIGGRTVPGWLNEGLAQWLEHASPDGRARAVDRARSALSPEAFFPLERLTGSLARWSDVDAIRAAYAQSLAFVDHLAKNYGERLLFDLVESCSRSRPPDVTFRARIGLDLSTALDDLARSL